MMESLASLDSLEGSIGENEKAMSGYIHLNMNGTQGGIYKLNSKQSLFSMTLC